MIIIDQVQRQQALDPTQSFIVQAPAGSGKTELLIQRYLTLLAYVEAPEQIVAITFTRKAAQEMRTRVMQALNIAAHHPEPSVAHQQKTWQLARTALARAQQQEWHLLQNPNRLGIQTFDGFCAHLNRQMPILSGFGALPEIVTDARKYYEQAAEQVWLNLAESENNSAIKNLLWHVDNNVPRLQRLLADLLACREQWLDYIGTAQNTQQLAHILQRHLHHLITDVLQQAHHYFPHTLKETVLELFAYAQVQCKQMQTRNKFLTSVNIPNYFPQPSLELLSLWQALANFLLTHEGQLRKRIDKNLGFPAKTEGKTSAEKAEFQLRKENMQALLAQLAEHPLLINALAHVQRLPAGQYEQSQQQIVIDLLEVLTLALAQLMILFAKNGVSDFNQLLLGALQALGLPEQPTDLALTLDYKIQHILVDEFQDTSVAQFRLLERLIAGWSVEDGRTLFLVGDPMQSIYRFRQAEVGLFLAAWERGIGQIPLVPLKLQVNFRAKQTLVEWINHHLAVAFPRYVDIGVGAVPFTPAVAFHQAEQSLVKVHAVNNAEKEALQVVALVQAALHVEDSLQEIAILVRTRNQLAYILPALQAAGIEYHAVDIESLSSRPVLHDLLVLTRALLHPADRVAWLALLRTPFCNLTLAELTHVVGEQPHTSVWERLQAIEEWSVFSEATQALLLYLISLLHEKFSQRQRVPVCQWILGTWLALNGPAYYQDASATADAQLFFELLEELETSIYQLTPEELEEQVTRLYATPKNVNSRVQIMTMHKAKGLEFDTVIIPGLHASNRSDSKDLLTWWERPRADGSAEVLIAPLHAVGEKEDKLYNYIWSVQQQAAELEMIRLLYVAVTRAKMQLHLVGIVETQEEEELLIPPVSNSLLAAVWPTVQQNLSYFDNPANFV